MAGDPVTLPADGSLSGSLRGGESVFVRVQPQPERWLRIQLLQDGIDADLFFKPDIDSAEAPVAASNPNDRWGWELLLFPPGKFAGPCMLELRPPQRADARGRFELRVTFPESPEDPGGLVQFEAERALSDAGISFKRGGTDNRRAALAHYAKAAELWRGLDSNREACAWSLQSMAEIYRLLGEAGQALPLFEQSVQHWKALGLVRPQLVALIQTGLLHRDLGDGERAMAVWREALELWPDAGDLYLKGQIFNFTGLVHLDSGRVDEALAVYREAYELFLRAGDSRLAAGVLTNIGSVFDQRGEPGEALDHFRGAIEILGEMGDRAEEMKVLANMGALRQRLGRFKEAFADQRRALELARAVGDRRWEARILNNLGNGYLALADGEGALDFLEKALAIRREIDDRRGSAIVLNNIGMARQLLGQTDRALAIYQEVSRIRAARGDTRGQGITAYLIGCLHLARGDAGAAEPHFLQAREWFRESGDERRGAWVLTRLGEVHAVLGDPATARGLLRDGLAAGRQTASPMAQIQALYSLARLEVKSGGEASAEAAFEEAIALTESLRTHVESPDLRISFLASKRDLYEARVDFLMARHFSSGAGEPLELALQVAEQAKVRGLLDVIEDSGTQIRAGTDGGRLDRHTRLLDRINAKSEALIAHATRAKALSSRADLERELRAALGELEMLETQIREENPRNAALIHSQPLSARQIQQSLDEDTLFLEFSLGETRGFLWLVSSTSIEGHLLPARSVIEAAVRELYQHWSSFDPTSRAAEGKLAQALSQMLLGPVAARLGERRLAIVADGVLSYLPFAALPRPNADPGRAVEGDRTNELMLVKHEMVNLPSASVLIALRQASRMDQPVRSRSGSVAIFADPVFSASDPRVGFPHAAHAEGNAQPLNGHIAQRPDSTPFLRLPATRREAETIMALAGGEGGKTLAALGFQANRQAVIDGSLAQYRVIHFATHGVMDSRQPALSGLLLSQFDARGQALAGFLGLTDIYRLDLQAELVVLSGCRTALGREIRGEGLIGLTRGFFYAGADRVLASLWQVQDQATAALMDRFYREVFQNQQTPAAALRAAQLSVYNVRKWRDPYFWAAFSLQGDWR